METQAVNYRKAYEESGQVIPEGWHVHHLCENNRCRNPAHLIAVSPEDHAKIHAAQTYCRMNRPGARWRPSDLDGWDPFADLVKREEES